MKKTLVILANSIRKSQRCIAGRVLNSDGTIGQWIRPVTATGEGEVPCSSIIMNNGNLPKLLDIVDIDFLENASKPSQPENILLNQQVNITYIGRFPSERISSLIESPSGLWSFPSDRSDRFSAFDDPNMYLKWQSLFLVKVQNPKMLYYSEPNPFAGYPKKNRRLIFYYNNNSYNFPITDPFIEAKYWKEFPKLNDPAVEKEFNANLVYLIASLTLPFKGFHYKIAANIIEA